MDDRDVENAITDKPRWRLALLGGFRLWSPDGVSVHPRLRVMRLIAFLALEGTCARATVAESLWPDSTQDHAMANLRTTAHQARSLCPGLIERSLLALALTTGTEVDIADIRDGDARSDPRELLSMPELLRGWYDEWVLLEREKVRMIRLLQLDTAVRDLRRTDPALAVTLAQFSADAAPLRESAQRTLIELHLEMGNRVEALRIYRSFRQLSLREFGVAPSAMIEDLVADLLAEQAARRGRNRGPRYA